MEKRVDILSFSRIMPTDRQPCGIDLRSLEQSRAEQSRAEQSRAQANCALFAPCGSETFEIEYNIRDG